MITLSFFALWLIYAGLLMIGFGASRGYQGGFTKPGIAEFLIGVVIFSVGLIFI